MSIAIAKRVTVNAHCRRSTPAANREQGCQSIHNGYGGWSRGYSGMEPRVQWNGSAALAPPYGLRRRTHAIPPYRAHSHALTLRTVEWNPGARSSVRTSAARASTVRTQALRRRANAPYSGMEPPRRVQWMESRGTSVPQPTTAARAPLVAWQPHLLCLPCLFVCLFE